MAIFQVFNLQVWSTDSGKSVDKDTQRYLGVAPCSVGFPVRNAANFARRETFEHHLGLRVFSKVFPGNVFNLMELPLKNDRISRLFSKRMKQVHCITSV